LREVIQPNWGNSASGPGHFYSTKESGVGNGSRKLVSVQNKPARGLKKGGRKEKKNNKIKKIWREQLLGRTRGQPWKRSGGGVGWRTMQSPNKNKGKEKRANYGQTGGKKKTGYLGLGRLLKIDKESKEEGKIEIYPLKNSNKSNSKREGKKRGEKTDESMPPETKTVHVGRGNVSIHSKLERRGAQRSEVCSLIMKEAVRKPWSGKGKKSRDGGKKKRKVAAHHQDKEKERNGQNG